MISGARYSDFLMQLQLSEPISPMTTVLKTYCQRNVISRANESDDLLLNQPIDSFVQSIKCSKLRKMLVTVFLIPNGQEHPETLLLEQQIDH